jgi:hypothetical protein
MKGNMIEQLEDRRLMAATFSLVGDQLTVANATNVQFNQDEFGQLYVVDKSLASAPVYYAPVTLTSLIVNGSSGADRISGGVDTITTMINGGNGNDIITFANNGANHATINDTVGKNTITVSNPGFSLGGTVDIFTNRSSSVSIKSTASSGVSVFRS